MKFALVASGMVLVVASFAIYQNLIAFGCAMNTTGCGGFSINYFSSEAALIFWPVFLCGIGLIGLGFKLRR